MNTPIIECNYLSKYYSSKNGIIKAVDNVNLKIYRNEFILIKGRSGAGKSTLINLMCGLEKPSKGSIVVDKTHLEKVSDRVLSGLLLEKIGIIFQGFNLLPTYTVYENIEIGLDPKKNNKESIYALLEKLDLKEKINALPPELSIGQQQRVAVARTLIKKPSIIFADEPTGAVDEITAHEIIQLILSLKKEQDATIVITSHRSDNWNMADRVLVMNEGKILINNELHYGQHELRIINSGL